MRSRLHLSILLALIFSAGCESTLESVILRPSSTIRRTPADFGYRYDETTLTAAAAPRATSAPTSEPAEDVDISVWHVYTTVTPKKGIMVIVPGNDANKGRYAVALPIFVDNGWDVILMDYAGFGKSTGAPTFPGLISSTDAVIRYATSQDTTVFAMGVSLGTAVIIRVAADHPELRGIILESTTNVWNEASTFTEFHGFGSPLWGIGDTVAALSTSWDYNSRYWITQVTSPKLFLHSPDDNVTPYAEAWQIYTAAPSNKHLFVTNGEHALQLFLDPVMYRSIVNGWLDGILGADPVLNQQFQEILDSEFQTTIQDLGFAPQ